MKLAWPGWLTMVLAFACPTEAVAAPGDVVRSFSAPTKAPHYATYPLGLGFDGGRLYIANIEEAKNPSSPYAIFAVDPLDGSVIDRIDYNAFNQTLKDMTWDGQRLWALNADRKRRMIDPATHDNQPGYRTMSTRMRGIAWDAACGHMWELVEETGTLSDLDVLIDTEVSSSIEVRDPISEQLVHSSTTEMDHSFWYSLAYDGCSLWTVDRESLELVRIDGVTGDELERLPTPSDRPIGLTYDGEHLMLSDNGSDQIYVIEIGATTLSDGTACDPTQPAACRVPGFETQTEEPDPPEPEPEPVADDRATTPGAAGGCSTSPADGQPSRIALLLLVAAAALRRRVIKK